MFSRFISVSNRKKMRAGKPFSHLLFMCGKLRKTARVSEPLTLDVGGR